MACDLPEFMQRAVCILLACDDADRIAPEEYARAGPIGVFAAQDGEFIFPREEP